MISINKFSMNYVNLGIQTKCEEPNGAIDYSLILKREKRDIMRILTVWNFDFDRVVNEIEQEQSWKLNLEPVILNDNIREMLDAGLFYLHGVDRSLRPINIMYPYKLEKWKGGVDDAHKLIHFVDKYTVDYLLVPGKVEWWTTIIDLANASWKTLSTSDIKKFITLFSHNYYSRNRQCYMVNVSTTVKMIWWWVRQFVDTVTKEKIVMSGKNTNEHLLANVHPKQLEKKYGGEADDVTEYWPPYSFKDSHNCSWCSSPMYTNEFGVDPNKLDLDIAISDRDRYTASVRMSAYFNAEIYDMNYSNHVSASPHR